VITRYFKFIFFAIWATRDGSVGSRGSGVPLGTEQNLQFLVHMFPRMRTVAVPRDQHWPRLGQFALEQMVCRLRSVRILSVSQKVCPAGKGLLSQGGSFGLRAMIIFRPFVQSIF
jgi:hypothetical protein